MSSSRQVNKKKSEANSASTCVPSPCLLNWGKKAYRNEIEENNALAYTLSHIYLKGKF